MLSLSTRLYDLDMSVGDNCNNIRMLVAQGMRKDIEVLSCRFLLEIFRFRSGTSLVRC